MCYAIQFQKSVLLIHLSFFFFFFLQLNLVCSSIYLLVQLILNELRASDSAQVLFVALTGNLQGQELQT